MCPVTPRDPKKVAQKELDDLVDQLPAIPTVEELLAVPRHVRIRFARRRLMTAGYPGRRVTQEDVALFLNVKARSVKRWESPTGNAPEPDHAARIADLANEGLHAKDAKAIPYPTWIFMTAPTFEETLGQELSRKLDLLLEHFGLLEPDVELLEPVELDHLGGPSEDDDSQRDQDEQQRDADDG